MYENIKFYNFVNGINEIKEIEIRFEILINMLNQAKLEGLQDISIKVLEEIIK